MRESWKTLERWYDVTEPLADPAPDAARLPGRAARRSQHAARDRRACTRPSRSALAGGLGFLGFSNVQLEDRASSPRWTTVAIADAIAARNAARKAKNFAESDRIRDELLAKGIVLKDGPRWHDLGGEADDHANASIIFDTTLRDGAQTQGVDFSVEDKRQIALALDGLGVDYIEGGWPGANPTDTAFFAERPPLKTRALHRLRHDQAVRAQRRQRSGAWRRCWMRSADAVCLVGKTWDFQVDVALEIPRSENIDNIAAIHRGGGGEEAASRCSTPSISSTATRPIPNMRSTASAPRMTRARAGSCCATPMAAPCRKMSMRIVSRSEGETARTPRSASTPITIPNRPWR